MRIPVIVMCENHAQKGLSLVELIISIVLISIALVVVSNFLNTGLRRSSDTLLELRTAALAQSYIDEILAKRFDENTAPRGVPPCRVSGSQCSTEVACPLPGNAGEFGPDQMEARDDYDDVDDYHCLQEGAAYGNDLEDSEGNVRTGYDNYSVSIEVRYIDIGIGGEEAGLGTITKLNDQYDAKVITVTVSHEQLSTDFLYAAYKANF